MYGAKRLAKPIVSASGSRLSPPMRSPPSRSKSLAFARVWAAQRVAGSSPAASSHPASSGAASGSTPASRSGTVSSGASQVGAWTAFVTWPIGTSSTGRPGQRPRHIARETAPCTRGDAVRARRDPERQRRHPEARLVGLDASESEDLVGRDPASVREAVEVAPGELLVELLVPGRHGRVRREDGRGAHELERGREGEPALLDEDTRALEAEEGGVALVHVEDRRLEPELAKRPHAADAEQQLLAEPVLAVAAVQHVGHLGLEQVEAHAARRSRARPAR